MVYVKENVVTFAPDIPQSEKRQQMGKQWRNLTDEQREYYFDKAEEDKQRFIQELEDYVPSKGGRRDS
jgi:hypothetical protein